MQILWITQIERVLNLFPFLTHVALYHCKRSAKKRGRLYRLEVIAAEHLFESLDAVGDRNALLQNKFFILLPGAV